MPMVFLIYGLTEMNKEEVIKLQSKLSSTIKTSTRSYQDKGDFLVTATATATAAKEARELWIWTFQDPLQANQGSWPSVPSNSGRCNDMFYRSPQH